MIGLKPGYWAFAAVTTALLSVSPLSAQRTTFNPVISLGYIYTDNVGYVGEEGTADAGLRLGLELPLVHELRKGSLSFTYSPRLDRYQDFSALDNTGHRLVASLETTPTPISQLNVSASFTQTQDQGDPTDPEADILISRRTERRRGSFGVSYRNRLGGRFLWGFSTSYTTLSFKDIEGFDTGDTTPIVDREALSGSLDLLRSLSRTTRLGVRLGYGQFELDVGGKEESREVGLVLEHAVGRSTQLALGLGIFESEGDAALGPGGSPNDTRDGSQGFLTLTRQLRKIELSLTGRHSPGSGGTLDSTSTDSSLGFGVGGAASRRLTWGVNTRYTRREPTDEELAVVETVALGLTLGLELNRRLRLQISPLYTEQVGNDEGVDSLVLSGAFGLAWAWAPLEKTRLGGGSG